MVNWAFKNNKQLNYFNICVHTTLFLKKPKFTSCLVETSCFIWNCLFIVQCCVQVLQLSPSFSPSLLPPPLQLSHILVTLDMLHVISSLSTYMQVLKSTPFSLPGWMQFFKNVVQFVFSVDVHSCNYEKNYKCPPLYFLLTWYCEVYHLQSIYFYLIVPTGQSHTQICVEGASGTAAWNSL